MTDVDQKGELQSIVILIIQGRDLRDDVNFDVTVKRVVHCVALDIAVCSSLL